MPSLPWIFVCPSSRGIGFHLTRHLLRTTTLPILATTRSKDLEAAKQALLSGLQHQCQQHDEEDPLAHRLTLTHLDVTHEPSIQQASLLAKSLFPPRTHHLHLSFAIPGILTPEKSPSQIDAASSLAMFQVNVAGPLLLAKHFVEFMPRRATIPEGDSLKESRLPEHATWMFMSARVGSVTENKLGGWYSYRASKAGVNSVAKSLDLMLGVRSGRRALAVAYHPGTVKTDFSKEFWGSAQAGRGLLDVEDAVEKMVEVVRGLDGEEERGKCLDWRGEVVPP
ncbi:hypothetical protein E4U19_001123 [Claviceps sp. Clav32 group G5]|nr:hypothetical protein E4U19_001123 [Claviceps sp. Clav32 group G5]